MDQHSELNKKKILIYGSVAVIASIILMIIFIPQLSPNNGQTDNIKDINVSEAYEMINDDENYPDLIVLDVRTQSEYDSGHLNNSILIPLDELENRLDELEEYKDTEIIVHCRSGSRSQAASEVLVANGFSKIYNMIGGISAWNSAGYPTV
ncbi:rhodanese-like domain-containing protein [Candidatus Lokiarchaeum ossiferum]|uniref:rhodanese-like domain-containing protein n=1 Tax=Candidatus Lokiarchaeum ossiferum TaxID=2951803 RepID=UPI00352D6399